ncbi:hypothetical protein O3P69_009167 [Scylla paramamosain]|uniref:Uncharacterized protein n=1 Tax=Scylla paramamosain TaxID=85552 RepID=A0AAW0T9B0_SCYPA
MLYLPTHSLLGTTARPSVFLYGLLAASSSTAVNWLLGPCSKAPARIPLGIEASLPAITPELELLVPCREDPRKGPLGAEVLLPGVTYDEPICIVSTCYLNSSVEEERDLDRTALPVFTVQSVLLGQLQME